MGCIGRRISEGLLRNHCCGQTFLSIGGQERRSAVLMSGGYFQTRGRGKDLLVPAGVSK